MKKLISIILILYFLLSCNIITASAEAPKDSTIDAENKFISMPSLQSLTSQTEDISKIKDIDNTKYINVSSNFKTHYANSDNLTVLLNISSLSEYDSTKTFFSSTENIILNNYKPQQFDHCIESESQDLTIAFNINPDIFAKTPLLDFKKSFI